MSEQPTGNRESEPATVLVVDDDKPLADLYADRLADRYRVRTAYGGEEAFDLLDASVDVVLLDRRMPELTGDEVLERIRERGLDCRVALVTAVEPDFDILEMGFDMYVTKPVDAETLTETVETLLGRQTYSERVGEYFSLVETKAALETVKPEDELAENDDYAELLVEIETLESELDLLVETFDDEDFTALVQDVERVGRDPDTPRNAPETSRDHSADSRDHSADSRDHSADSREDSADSREDSADSREDSTDSREDSDDIQEDSDNTQEDSDTSRDDSDTTRPDADESRPDADESRPDADESRPDANPPHPNLHTQTHEMAGANDTERNWYDR